MEKLEENSFKAQRLSQRRIQKAMYLPQTLGALAATLAASLYCPPWNSVLNLRTNRSSAPGRLLRDAIRSARSGLDREFVMYWMIFSSSTATESTWGKRAYFILNILHSISFLNPFYTRHVASKYTHVTRTFGGKSMLQK